MNRHAWLRSLARLHWPSVAAMAALMVIGVAFVYSAGYRGEELPPAPFYRRQIVWCLIGLAAFLVAALYDYRRLGAQAMGLYMAALLLLTLVLVFGVRAYGARRWLEIFGQRVQPSEGAKLAAILVLARYLSRPHVRPAALSTLGVTALIVGIPFVLIAAEPDLGSALALVPPAAVLLLLAGVPWRTLGLLMLGGLIALPLGWLVLSPYQRDRLIVFLDPGRDPLGAGWNSVQSAIAVGSGGPWGKGYLRGTQNVLGFLPRTVAPTDFIFSVIAEEKGFAGSAVLLGLYGVVIAGGLLAAARARDKFGQLWAAGLTALLFFHVFTNIAMTIGLMPVTGLPLPFVSYGGSFMAAAALAAGSLQSVYIRRPPR